MSIACIIVMGILPYVWVGLAKFGGRGGFDNHNPRAALSKLVGWRQRANAAQANQLEAFPLFAAAVLFATFKHAPQSTLGMLALSVVLLRIVYGILYIWDKSTMRSLVWFISLTLTIVIFFI